MPLRAPGPMLATLVETLPVGDRWSYEVKWDGYRTIAVKDGGRAALYSRNLRDATRLYPAVARAVAALGPKSLMLDGEIVALDEEGRHSFQALHHQAAKHFVFYVFDLLHVNGRDLFDTPLTERRAALRRIRLRSPILRSDPLPGEPAEIEAAVRGLGLEGIVAKRIDSPYEAGRRSHKWLKVKFQHRQELVIGGFRPEADWVDALVVGYYDQSRLISVGKVRAGLTPQTRRELYATLLPLQIDTCPFANLPEPKSGRWGAGVMKAEMSKIVWVEPKLVAEVAFTEWTQDNHLRHASFIGLRADKRARDIGREDPAKLP